MCHKSNRKDNINQQLGTCQPSPNSFVNSHQTNHHKKYLPHLTRPRFPPPLQNKPKSPHRPRTRTYRPFMHSFPRHQINPHSRVLSIVLHIVLQSQDDILGLLGGDIDRKGVFHVRLPWLRALIVFVRSGGAVEPGCAGAAVGLFRGNTVGSVGGRHGFGTLRE